MKPLSVFLDSDVLVSSCLSDTGAASLLLNQDTLIKFYTNIQEKELQIVFKRLSISPTKLSETLQKCALIDLKSPNLNLYSTHTTDLNDRHIVAGAVASNTRCLISYNIKHFQIETIKRDFGINTLTPAQFLQFLRSTGKI